MKTLPTKNIIISTITGVATGVSTYIVLLFFAGMLSLTSCNKTPDFDTPDTPTPTEQAVNQNFSMQISTQTTPLTKGWTPDTWVTVYSPTPANLVLTGTGASVGRTYSKSVTIAELKAGTVSMTLLPGSYKATFVTPHQQSTDPFSLNNVSISYIYSPVGDVLDIKIDNDLTCTGTPLTLTATLDDYLIITDIPTEYKTEVYNNAYFSGATSGNGFPLLMNSFYATKGFHYGYQNEKTNYKLIPSNKVINGTGFVKGNAYHIISNFQASTVLNIPDFIQNEIIVP